MQVNEVVASVRRGEVPPSLEGISEWLDEVVGTDRATPPVKAMLIAAARKNHFGEDMPMIQAWQRWVQERYGLGDTYICHCNKVGKMLFAFVGKPEAETLLEANMDTLVYLTRLPHAGVSELLATHDVLAMPRDAVQAEVAMMLGERVKPKEDGEEAGGGMVQPELNLWGAVDRLCQVRPDEFDALGKEIDAPDKADRVFWAGFGLIDSGIEFAKGGKYDAERIRKWGPVMVAQQRALMDALKNVDPTFEG